MTTYEQIIAANANKKTNELSAIYKRLLYEKIAIESFFDVFLHRHDLPLYNEKSSVWETYNKKYDEYEQIKFDLNLAKYYMEN